MIATPDTTSTPVTPTKYTSRLQDHAEAIRSLSRRMIVDVVEIGRRLSDVRRISGHGNFGHWIEHEFGWSPSAAKRFIQVFDLVSKTPKLGDLHLPLAGVYLLAQDSTPEHVIDEVITRVEDGEVLPLKEIRALIPRKGGIKAKPKALQAEPGGAPDIVSEAYALVMRMTLDQRRNFVARLPGLVSLRSTPSPSTPVSEPVEAPSLPPIATVHRIVTDDPDSKITYTPEELKARVEALNADVDPATGVPRYLKRQSN